MSVNIVVLSGFVGNQPELRKTGAGTSVCTLRIPTEQGAEDARSTEWHSVTVWGKQAETCAEHLGPGRYVTVTGRVRTRSRDVEGSTIYSTEIEARNVDFGNKKA